MDANLDRSLLARDAYGSWKRRVQQATGSVRVFTPYLDAMLGRLLGNASIGEESLSVVTDLSPMSGALDYRAQLVGVRALLRRGIEVRSLPRLHAKVLVCDGQRATVGSQNFTTYARSSKETAAVVPTDVTDSTFIRTLDEWFEQAVPVDLRFIEELLKDLELPIAEMLKALQELDRSFGKQWRSYLERLESERQATAAASRLLPMAEQLERARNRSVVRLARAEVLTHLEWLDSGYATLRTQSDDATLTTWLGGNAGSWSNTELKRLDFHTLILNPTGRMGFVRVTQTRFTYVRTSVRRTNAKVVCGQRCWLTVRFPDDNLEHSNVFVHVAVDTNEPFAQLELQIKFDGVEASLAAWDLREPASHDPSTASILKSEGAKLRHLVGKLELQGLDELLSAALGNFKFAELKVENHNAADFFPQGWLGITLLDYENAPILMATPV